MALTTRAISWSILGINGAQAYGTITITPNIAQLVDTVGLVTYIQNTLTYPIASGVSDPLITTDNTGTNPSAGNWGYNITIQLTPGTPDISVQDVSIPAGDGNYALATILNAAGL